MRIILLVTLIFFAFTSEAQPRYWVFIGESEAVKQVVTEENVALSERALARRARQNIPLRPTDIPVDKKYVRRLQEMGFTVHGTSRWLRAVSVVFPDERVEFWKTALTEAGFSTRAVATLQTQREENYSLEAVYCAPMAADPPPAGHWYDYGRGWAQTHMVRGEVLHDSGWDGTGMLIALLDGSFMGAESSGHFARAFNEGRVLGTWDFVNGDTNVFRPTGSHGKMVWSIIQTQSEGQLVGSAPRASFLLLRTEDELQETKVEEDNWIMAAEYADSAGADVINSSLSYTTFDAPDPSYDPSDLDGRTALVTQGAVMAHRAGMIVVVSGGNSGSGSWHYIGMPADADSILAVGAVDSLGRHGLFSGYGPSADGRIKPDVSAMGVQTAHIGGFNGVATGNGTSFSSPVIAGFAACFWSAVPSATNYQIIDWVRKSAHLYTRPNDKLGYGIPNFYIALQLAGVLSSPVKTYRIYPNPVHGEITLEIKVNSKVFGTAQYELWNARGQKVQSGSVQKQPIFNIDLKQGLSEGIYMLRFESEGLDFTEKILIRR